MNLRIEPFLPTSHSEIPWSLDPAKSAFDNLSEVLSLLDQGQALIQSQGLIPNNTPEEFAAHRQLRALYSNLLGELGQTPESIQILHHSLHAIADSPEIFSLPDQPTEKLCAQFVILQTRYEHICAESLAFDAAWSAIQGELFARMSLYHFEINRRALLQNLQSA